MRCTNCGEEILGDIKFCLNYGVICCEDGVYRWLYEYKMFTNPAIPFMVWRMFLRAIGIGWLILIPFALIAKA